MRLFDKFFKKKESPTYLYDDLKPGARIDRLLVEYLAPVLEPEGFKYLKSQRAFRKKGDFFDLHLSWYGRKFNQGNRSVRFEIIISSYSPKYRKWESEYYHLEHLSTNAVDGSSVEYIDGWDHEFLTLGTFDLVKYDNVKLMESIVENTKGPGFRFFDCYSTLDTAIEKLKEYPIKNLEKIVDFYILQDKWHEADEFFQNNKHWHEGKEKSEGQNPKTTCSNQRKRSFELRKEQLDNWRK